MRRRLLNLLTVVSLLACVAVCAMWVRSYWRSDYVSYTRVEEGGGTVRELSFCCLTGSGHSAVVVTDRAINLADETLAEIGRGWNAGSDTDPDDPFHSLGAGESGPRYLPLQFSTEGSRQRGFRVVMVGFPLWLLAIMFALLPARQVYRHLKHSHRAGTCPRCGYDLRATPDRCPECGATARYVIRAVARAGTIPGGGICSAIIPP